MITAAQFFAGTQPIWASAPGRVNLLGEHTDYNDGYMLPVATPQRTAVGLAASSNGDFHFYSATLDQSVQWSGGDTPATGFARYIVGCIDLVAARGITVPPLRMHVSSTLAVGAGLSSSAALELATLRALRQFLQVELDDITLAQIAQQAEIRYAGVNCGIMDQMASSLADEAHMLFLDARTLETRLLPLPPGCELVVIDTGVARRLSATGYNTRRTECETAARMLDVRALRDVVDPAAVEALPEPYRKRARHVVQENLRVLTACGAVSAVRFGELMNASHASLRDDYEVSVPALDELTALLQAQPEVYGARLTGAGFGGACVALCATGHGAAVGVRVLTRYDANPDAGERRGRLLIPIGATGADDSQGNPAGGADRHALPVGNGALS
ncbi:MAG: galactokinase [Herminiimonas sp.]|nr:galactokinase [Herminiimonas sp.]